MYLWCVKVWSGSSRSTNLFAFIHERRWFSSYLWVSINNCYRWLSTPFIFLDQILAVNKLLHLFFGHFSKLLGRWMPSRALNRLCCPLRESRTIKRTRFGGTPWKYRWKHVVFLEQYCLCNRTINALVEFIFYAVLNELWVHHCNKFSLRLSTQFKSKRDGRQFQLACIR